METYVNNDSTYNLKELFSIEFPKFLCISNLYSTEPDSWVIPDDKFYKVCKLYELAGIQQDTSNQTDESNTKFYKRRENIRILESFKNLEKNWDSEGAEPFDVAIIEKCIDIIKSPFLRFQPDIYPTGRGSIQFEYEKSNGEYLEIEIFLEHLNYYYEDQIGKEVEQENVSWEDVLKYIEDFHA